MTKNDSQHASQVTRQFDRRNHFVHLVSLLLETQLQLRIRPLYSNFSTASSQTMEGKLLGAKDGMTLGLAFGTALGPLLGDVVGSALGADNGDALKTRLSTQQVLQQF